MKRRESIRSAKEKIAAAAARGLSTTLRDDEEFRLLAVHPFDDVPVVRVEARVRVEHPQYEDGEAWEQVSFDVAMTEVQG